MIPLHPIEIVGGGLAGLSLGLALRRAGVPVSVHEAGDYPRHRVCGEFIAGLDDDTIAILGLAPVLAGAARHVSVTWFSNGRRVRHTLPEPAYGICRYDLDLALAGAFVAAGGDLHVNSRIFPLTARPGRVLAAGRRRHPGSPWLGVKAHYRNLPIVDDLEVHLCEAGYVGLARIDPETVNVCGLLRIGQPPARRRGDPRQVLRETVSHSGLHELALRLGAADLQPESCSAVAGLGFDARVRAADTLSIGDACAMIPPFTGHGMAMAFQSAVTCLEPLLAYARGELTWTHACQRANRALRRRFSRRLASAGALHPVLMHAGARQLLGRLGERNWLPIRRLYSLLHQ